jgi:hypothetical protein
MNSEIAEMKVKLAVLKEQEFRLNKEWGALAGSVRRGVNPMLKDVGAVEMDELDIVWDRMKEIWIEISQVREKIDRLKKVLE